jgi:hypothetical protein
MNDSLSRFSRLPKKCMRYWLLCLMVPSSIVVAQTSAFSPADFAAENRFAEIVVSPGDMPGGRESLLVLCQGFVESDGELTNYYCLIDEIRANRLHGKVLRTVIDTLSTQKFVPAKVDGDNVRVLLNFAVAIDCTTGSCVVIPVRNHGYHFAEYGPDYVSPQPILIEDAWYEGFEDKRDWIEDWMAAYRPAVETRLGEFIAYTMSVEVSADGVAYDESVDWLDPGSEATGRLNAERAAASIGSPRFIPGFHEGQPVAMRLYERSVIRPK